MPGTVDVHRTRDIATITLRNDGKLNAIDIAMWHALRTAFLQLQAMPVGDAPSAVIVCGANGNFAAGGDIAEFAGFRFDAVQLRHFHDHIVAPALHSMLDCDLPVYAQIDGACIGGGLEIAACCDVRVCGSSSRFGAPIAKLGFPMAPTEVALLARVFGAAVLREMLLEARLYDAATALRCGLVHEVVDDTPGSDTLRRDGSANNAVAACVQQRCSRIAAGLSPQAARLNKQALRQLATGRVTEAEHAAHFNYADSFEHREGVSAFIEKRTPRFRP
jgi:enoyl-CoA hydratase